MGIRFFKFINKLRQKLFNKSPKIEASDLPFHSLSPNDCVKNGEHYFDALKWALSNRKEKNIRNIALTGSYGSGKSSILQTFQKNNKDKNIHFLNISLATFKKEKEPENKTEGENLQRLIELSILQQLFYKEKDANLPDSRLKRIASFSTCKLFVYALCSVFFIISFVLLFNPQILNDILPKTSISETIETVIHYIALVFSIVGLFCIAYKSVRILHNLKISKLNIKDAEIEINSEINKSVLNHNIEEILYFFEVTKYNVVIIEDLDRFEETEIFTKLREVNLLINNSKKINKNVVFIYAVRDNMFTDKDRTKFFDFIIPIIPVINASNSNEILLKEFKEIDANVSESLIDDISLFIDEMRVLFNIINEFQIYKKLIGKNLNSNKLLAMIVYKNICPYDFVKLSNYEGELYDTINKKLEYIKHQIEEIDKEISKYKEEITQLEELKIKDIKELRSLYVLQYIKQINTTYAISYFYLNSKNCTFDQVLEDDAFPHLIGSNNVYFGGNYQSRTQQSIAFQAIEKQVDSKYTYKEREQQINDWNNDKVSELKQKIMSLEQKKIDLRHEKISKLLSDKSVTIETTDNKQKLISILLRNSYIDEEYLDYISLFHEGSLSKHDNAFLQNVKEQTNTVFNYNLDHIANLIRKINIVDFGKEHILNYKLVDFVVSNNGYEKQKEAIFILLSNESDISLRFIDEFINDGINISAFIKALCHSWNNIWHYLQQSSNYSKDEQKSNHYFKLIIENADTIDIKAISDESNLKQHISQRKDFCSIITGEEKIKEILKALDIKFEDLSIADTPDELLNYIYQNNHYQINPVMLTKMIQVKENFNQVDFDTRNYYAIKNSRCAVLIKYIEENIYDYVSNVYLKLETNTKEDEECLINLLNNNKLRDYREKIIQRTETKVSDLCRVDVKGTEDFLLIHSKLQPNWKNIIERFVRDGNTISKPVLEFLNNEENAEVLSKLQIETEKPDKETVYKFLEALLLNYKIKNESYTLILNSVPYIYSSLNIENLSKEKTKILIDKNKLKLTEKNYSKLAENFDDLHIFLIEKRYGELSEVINSLAFDEEDIYSLLKSSVLPYKSKEEILNYYGDTDIIADSDILDLIGNILLEQNSFNVSKEVKKAILTKSKLNIEDKVALFNNINSIFETRDITAILQSFPEPYSDIAEKGKRPTLPDRTTNANFAKILKDIEYISDYKNEKKGIRISTFRK
ncbi:MAG: hypothetical protein LBM67_03715 [Lentimicrobiaceae bacterium]|jgi:hypothetical protein|nr:hypothetical protein [Lentimicrobiaceae bacterium]